LCIIEVDSVEYSYVTVNLTVYNPLGRRVRELIPGGLMGTGESKAVINGRGLVSGQYYLILKTSDESIQYPITMVR